MATFRTCHSFPAGGHISAPAVPWWTLLEAATAAGFAFPHHRPGSSGQSRHCERGGATKGPQPCSSRQSRQAGNENTSGNQDFNCEEFFANAAAIARALLGEDDSPKSENTTTATTSNETLSTKHSHDGFEVKLDVSNFAPNELNVKTVDNTIVIQAKHEEKQDAHGFISRAFTRKYVLPEGVKAENVTCKLASNGILVISASVIQPTPVTNERSIPINFTGQPAFVTNPQASAPVAETGTSNEGKADEDDAAGTDIQISTDDDKVTTLD